MNSTKTSRGIAVALVAAVSLLQGAPVLAEVVASEGWARASVPGAKEGAGYLVLTNKGDEDAKLLAITTSICDKVMIHRSTIDSQGVSRMWPVAKLEIAPGETVRFDPSILHIMFFDIPKPFVAGQKVPLRLIFEGQPALNVQLEVRPLVPAATVEHAQK